MHASELATTTAKTNFPWDIKGSWWNVIGFFLIGPSSPAKTGQEDTDQSDLYWSEHQPICLSQEKQA